jgi:hypothetical protein
METLGVVMTAAATLLLAASIFHLFPIAFADYRSYVLADEASQLIQSQITHWGEMRTGNRLIISQDVGMSTKSISSRSGLVTPAQLCISLGDYHTTTGFHLRDAEAGDNTLMTYSNINNVGVALSVMCDTGSVLRADLTKNGFPAEWMDSTPLCQSLAVSDGVGCIVALRTA